MKNVLFVLVVFISIISFHCQKELSHVNVGGNQNGFLPAAITLQGNINDENGQPASGVTIKAGGQITTTDARGYFRVVNATIIKKSVLVTAERPGYFKAYRSFIPTDGVNQVMIKLTRKDLSGQVNSSTDGDVTISNGSKVSLPANSVVTASGGTYTGTVNVYAAYIDPTSKDISETIPSSLMGDNKDGKRVSLTSYGMLAVQLESSTGDKLQIAEGSTAALTFPIPSSIQSSAPASISLWYIDEQTGIWKEEGTAAKNGNKYVGVVKHFSFWNCDVPSPAVMLTMTLQSTSGSPMVFTEVRLITAGGRGSDGWTDSLGQVSGAVPSDTALLLEIIGASCNNVIYSKNIGPFNQSTDLGVITIDLISSMVTIRGRLVNCGNSAVTNGYAIVSVDNLPRYLDIDNTGNFKTEIFICPGAAPSCQILGIDRTAQKQGVVTSFNIVRPETNLADVSACGSSSEQFINYTLDGIDHSITSDVTDSIYGSTDYGGTYIQGAYNADNIGIWYANNGITRGTFPLGRLYVTPYYDSIGIVMLSPLDITITHYPQNIGEFYEGQFSGQFTYRTTGATIHNINCSFRVRRRQ